MALRPALILLSAALVASLATGWPVSFMAAQSQPPATAPAEDQVFKERVQPFLKKYCGECHSGDKPKGGLTLDAYQSEAHARKDRKNWGTVQHGLASGDMPPAKAKKPLPTKEEKEFIISWIENTLTKVDCGANAPRDPGRVTIRRLNR